MIHRCYLAIIGYRHLDCAWVYKNEEEIGVGIEWALKEGICKREDLYITTKLSGNHFRGVRGAIEDSLKKLKLGYVDLYLIHVPVEMKMGPEVKSASDIKPEHIVGYSEARIAEVWVEMEKLVESGLTRSIGVSNFTIKKLESLLKAGKLVPAVNQCEAQAYFQQEKLRQYCRSKGIVFEAYNSLGNPGLFKDGLGAEVKPLLENGEVKRLSEKHTATPAQICIAFALALGDIAIPKTTTESRLRENLASLNVKLDEEDVKALRSLEKGLRLHPMKIFTKPTQTFEEFWDVEFDSAYKL